jgi:hypothetical protein
VRSRLRPDLVAQHAEIFLINGDMNSNLYTSSRAMHSSILSLLQPDGSGMSKAGVGRLQNISVSVQRRWNNVLSDSTRQVAADISHTLIRQAGGHQQVNFAHACMICFSLISAACSCGYRHKSHGVSIKFKRLGGQ